MIAPAEPARKPCVLLLQGPRSPFMARLRDALAADGAQVHRVLFCAGDVLFWGGRPATRWRGRPQDWPPEAARLIATLGVTDVLGLGDGRPAHRAAFAAAHAAGARVHVLEQGLIRPGWITLEPDRLGGWRPGPGVPTAPLPRPGPGGAGFAAFAAMDVAHHLANMTWGRLVYPHHRSHELRGPLIEWAGWALKTALTPRRAAERRAALARIAAAHGPVFLFALQLETDFQLRDNGPPEGSRAALAAALAGFARAASPDALIVVKPHPLDPGLTPWRRIVAESPAADRAVWLDGGDLDALLPRLAGVVAINSTVGLSALRAGTPVALLGRAVYEGLCAHRPDGLPLDGFWTDPPRPDPAAVSAFVAALLRDIQLPGAFDGPGMETGARAVAARIMEGT
jgi:capsular polysaccharide export protein